MTHQRLFEKERTVQSSPIPLQTGKIGSAGRPGADVDPDWDVELFTYLEIGFETVVVRLDPGVLVGDLGQQLQVSFGVESSDCLGGEFGPTDGHSRRRDEPVRGGGPPLGDEVGRTTEHPDDVPPLHTSKV
jgi:hypothetical protein